MNKNQEKIAKISSIFSKATTVFMILSVILAVVLLAASILILSGTVNLDTLKLHAPVEAQYFVQNSQETTLGSVINPKGFAGLLGFAFISLIVGFLLLKELRAIFVDLSKGVSPFHVNQVQRLKKIANRSIVIALIGIVASLYLRFTLNQPNLDLSINFGTIIFPFIIYFLAYIFEYGVELQQLSDETL
ncbi:MAG: hypothetical protein GYA87_08315 [Christensenellaceae bacterium]|nr:hypothetical protein [Christensenellaceae bacterium]